MPIVTTPLLPELAELDALVAEAGSAVRVETLAHVEHGGTSFPIRAIHVGASRDTSKPVFMLIGGVHGLERIGTLVILAHLRTVLARVRWDVEINALLSRVHMIFVPIVNPVGMWLGRRSNGNHVDLMRNAPVQSAEPSPPWMIFRGHRISPALPYYRGAREGELEVEAAALCELVREHVFPARLAVCVDVHSGFGRRDQIWFPYARSRAFFPSTAEVVSLANLLDQTYSHHRYRIEPQSLHYTADGDLWDYLYDEHRNLDVAGVFLPLTLELGSWAWIRRNPGQALSRLGLFHPMVPHRVHGVRGGHHTLLHFLERATAAPEVWASPSADERRWLERQAYDRWPSMG